MRRHAGDASSVGVAFGVALGVTLLAGAACAADMPPAVPPAVPPVVPAVVPAVVPYRPTAANPADLPAPGYAELEAGYLQTRAAGVTRSETLPILLKFGINEQWALLAGTDAWDRERDGDGARFATGGDTSITLKQRIGVNDALAFGLEYGVLLPTARAPVTVGCTQWSINSIVSADVRDVRIDANLMAIRVGAPADGQGRMQAFAAVAVSTPLAGRWTIAGDMHATLQHGTTPDTTAMAALSFAATPQVVFDVAAAAGLAHAAPHWQATAGVTVLLGRWL